MQYLYDTSTPGKFKLTVNQTAYIKSMITRFGLEDSKLYKHVATPLPVFRNEDDLKLSMGKNLDQDQCLVDWAKEHSYACIIGSLIHAMVWTRPDIALAVSWLSRSMACPQLYHWKAARRTLIYLRETSHLGLFYSQEEMLKQYNLLTGAMDDHVTDPTGKIDLFDQYLKASVDASFADCIKTYRSTSGFVVWFGGFDI